MTASEELIRAAARQQRYLTRDNMDLLEVEASGVREKSLSIWSRHLTVQLGGAFCGTGRLKFDLLDAEGRVVGQSSCMAQFSGVVDATAATVHSVAVEEI